MTKLNLVLFSATLILSCIIVRSSADEVTLESPRVTSWGEWGTLEMCPPLEFVYSFRLKVQEDRGEFEDDSAANGIELTCISPQARRDENTEKALTILRSSFGDYGTWKSLYECTFPHFGIGFQLRSEGRVAVDNTAANNFRLVCSNEAVLEGDGDSRGDWTERRTCPLNKYICGLRTQVEAAIPFPGDNTSLNNIDIICCDIPI